MIKADRVGVGGNRVVDIRAKVRKGRETEIVVKADRVGVGGNRVVDIRARLRKGRETEVRLRLDTIFFHLKAFVHESEGVIKAD